MGLKKVLLCFLILLICIVGFGCSNIEDKNMLRAELVRLEKENMKLEQEKESLNFNIEHITEINRSMDKVVQEQVYILGLSDEERKDYTVLPIYNANVYAFEKEISYYVYLPIQSTLEEKMNILAEKLSKYSFRNLPIDIKGMEIIDNKRIAVVNLQEHDQELNTIAWNTYYFQGSTGGTMTSTTLIETFLQREYEGQWVDGVKILYNNTQTHEFIHVEGLLSTHYRN